MAKKQIEITLVEPVKNGDEEISVIKLKRPKVKHLKAMDRVQGDVSKVIEMISELANVPPSVVGEFDLDDLEKCNNFIAGFVKKPQAT